MLNYFDVIKAQSGVPVEDIWTQLWGDTMGSEYVITTYEGTLPATLTETKAGYLESYKIYGNTENGESVGERTENLWDAPLVTGAWRAADGMWLANIPGYVSNTSKVSVDAETTYSFTFAAAITSINRLYVYFWDSDNTYLGYQDLSSLRAINTPSNTAFITVSIGTTATSGVIPSDISNIMLNLGSTAPTSYIPYGYKLPMVVTNGTTTTTTPIYIGSDPLAEDEYVDFGKQKIYRMVNGTLTPTDPPAPIPALPTIEGETIIDWAGEGLAPSQVELKYHRR